MDHKRVLIIEGSPRKKGNSQLLCEAFQRGAQDAGHIVDFVRIQEKKIGFCMACDSCMSNGGTCVLRDDMAAIIELLQKADVLVLGTPIYFNGVSAQIKTFIDRTYPIWQNLGQKDVYYIVTAGLGEDVISRSICDLDGFVEYFDGAEVKGRIYAPNVMDAGLVKDTELIVDAYQMGKSV